jgi:CRISPR system Cascade subunit CasA
MGADGRRLELGIRAVLSRAHELREVRDESPLTTMALMRLLLAVTHAALEGPADLATWKRLWSAGHLPEKRITAYLDKWQGRFDLFDPKYPFFQVGGFEVVDKDGQAKEPTPVTKLTHERATGNSATLFDHSVEESEIAVSPSVAARWLVTCQSYALGGGVGGTSNKFGKHPNFTHAPMVGGVAVVLDGSSLFETLMLNLVVGAESGPIPSKGHDAPVWERDRIDSPEERRPRGLLEFLTWRARMVRLLPVTANGAVLVKQMQYAPGWEVAEDVVNPAWAYVTDEKRGERPIGLRQGRVL